MDKLATSSINALKALPRKELLELPPVSEESIQIDENHVTVTTYHDHLSDDRHLIAVQIIVPKWFGLSSTVIVRGFVLTVDDSRIDAEEPFLWPFM